MTSAYTQTHTHTNTNTLQSKLRVQIGWRGEAGGGWWRLKWKSRTDQYCWRFSSLHSPLNCHAHSKQLKALCLSTSTPILFLSFHPPPPLPCVLWLSVQVAFKLPLPATSSFHVLFRFLLGVTQYDFCPCPSTQLHTDASRTRS